jgi:hypothetical protein
MRQWLDEHAGGGPFPQETGPRPELTHEAALDRYSQHTRDCPHCSQVLSHYLALCSTAALLWHWFAFQSIHSEIA